MSLSLLARDWLWLLHPRLVAWAGGLLTALEETTVAQESPQDVQAAAGEGDDGLLVGPEDFKSSETVVML
jgi:hypothetical protein